MVCVGCPSVICTWASHCQQSAKAVRDQLEAWDRKEHLFDDHCLSDSHVLSLAALDRTVQEGGRLVLGLGIWRPFLRRAFLGQLFLLATWEIG